MAPKRWSLSAAAQFAREARISTAVHLADAPIARRWHATKMMRAYQIHAENLRSRDAARVMLYGGLGYPPPYPSTWEDAADLVVGDEATYLAGAELYILTPQMCDVVIAAASTLTVDDLKLLEHDDLPSPTGLVVLPHPLLVRSIGGGLGDHRAYHWQGNAAFVLPRPDATHDAVPAVRVATYHDTHGPVRPDSFVDFLAQARREGTPLPPLSLDGIRCLAYRAVEADPEAVHRLSRAAKAIDGAMREVAGNSGQDEDRVVGEYTPGAEINDGDDTFVVRFLYAFWRLCEQRIAGVEHIQVSHAAQLRAQRTGVPPDVRIVRLRLEDAQPAATTGSKNWQHRWVVKMHKVRQWYPSEHRHKVIYRGPYLKGPADKPLLGGETARALLR